MAKMFMEKMHAFGNLLQDEWQVFTTPETHLPKMNEYQIAESQIAEYHIAESILPNPILPTFVKNDKVS